jgi:hypothetical protein
LVDVIEREAAIMVDRFFVEIREGSYHVRR